MNIQNLSAPIDKGLTVLYLKNGEVILSKPKFEGYDKDFERMSKLEIFCLCDILMKELAKDPQLAQDLFAWKESIRERDENQLQYHRQVEEQAFIESEKISSSPEATTHLATPKTSKLFVAEKSAQGRNAYSVKEKDVLTFKVDGIKKEGIDIVGEVSE